MNFIKYLFILIPFLGLSQYCPSLGPDQYLPCGVLSTTLTADFSQCGIGLNPNETTNYGVSNIPFSPQTNTGTQINMTDDSQQGPFNIGFTFCFFGQTYTQFYVGSNGWVSFSAGQPTTFTSATIPSAAINVPKNCIMGPWQDWHPGIGGQIRYQVQGTAPCRKLVVSWLNVPMFSCTSNLGTFHIVLYESTNIIENHIQNKPACTWAGGTAVQGIHNLGGTIGIVVPGRNSTQWTANNDSWRYTPSGPEVLPIPTWYEVGNPVSIGQGNSIVVFPPQAGAFYTCHLEYPSCNLGWNSCNGLIGVGPDTVFVQPGPPGLQAPTINFTNPTCFQSCDGAIDVSPTNGVQPFTYSWSNGFTTSSISNLCAGVYTITITDAIGCDVIANTTLTDPPAYQINPINGTEPDTICFDTQSNLFSVNDLNPSPTYFWSSTSGIITNLQNYQVNLDLTNIPGGLYNDIISVYGVDANGCQSQVETFDVYILDLSPSIDTILPLCEYDNCSPLVGYPSGGVFTGPNIFNNQFCPDSTIIGLNTLTYTYTQSNCVFSSTIDILINPRPEIFGIYNNMGQEGYQFNQLCEGDVLLNTYEAQTSGGNNIWTYLNDTIQSEMLSLEWNQTGIYSFYLTTENNGCISYPYVFDVALGECVEKIFYVPNSFTPDGDEHNQTWKPVFTEGFDSDDFNLTIFNRWGELIFESNDPQQGWDGTYNGMTVQDGIYIWKIEFGVLGIDERVLDYGHLVIIR